MVFHARKAPLRYYIYVSDYKLDMLYEQISPAQRRRISGELDIDLKLAGLTLRGSEQPDATRITKLRAIERYIDKHCHVGDISDPGREFFRGSMDLQWGWLTPRPDCPCAAGKCESIGWGELVNEGNERTSPVVMFRGVQRRAEGADFVLLGGSRIHVLDSGAENNPAALLSGGSLMSALVIALEKNVSQLTFFKPGGHLSHAGPKRAIEAGMHMIMKGPRQRLDFLAVPFGQAEFKQRDGIVHGVIGTPIYVAHG